MGQSRAARGSTNDRRGDPGKPAGLPPIIGSMVVAPIPVIAWLLPTSLVLPTLSAVLLASAAIASLLAWLGRTDRSNGDRLTLWDLAAAFAFVGCAAGSLSETTSVAQLFGVVMAIP